MKDFPSSRPLLPVVTTGLERKPLEAFAAAEPLTFDRVYADHVQVVAHWGYRLGGPLMDVEDVVQDVFLTVHRELPQFRGAEGLRAWLFRITHNVVRHRGRKERLRRFLRGTAEDVAGHQPATTLTPVESLEQQQVKQKFYRVLDRLPERYRLVLILFELEGMSGEEIARLIGDTRSNVFVRLHRARAAFLKQLSGLERAEEI